MILNDAFLDEGKEDFKAMRMQWEDDGIRTMI